MSDEQEVVEASEAQQGQAPDGPVVVLPENTEEAFFALTQAVIGAMDAVFMSTHPPLKSLNQVFAVTLNAFHLSLNRLYHAGVPAAVLVDQLTGICADLITKEMDSQSRVLPSQPEPPKV